MCFGAFSWLKTKTPSISVGRSRASNLDIAKVVCLPVYSDATCPFPELLWSLPLQQARFPDFRLERVASRPSQSRVEISDVNGSYAIAGTQWREPSGHFTQLPLSPLMGTCDGPTRRRRVGLAIADVTKNRFCEATNICPRTYGCQDEKIGSLRQDYKIFRIYKMNPVNPENPVILSNNFL